MKGDEARMREAGCDGYVSKPISRRSGNGPFERDFSTHHPRLAEAGARYAFARSGTPRREWDISTT
jgi:hypothetical protein